MCFMSSAAADGSGHWVEEKGFDLLREFLDMFDDAQVAEIGAAIEIYEETGKIPDGVLHAIRNVVPMLAPIPGRCAEQATGEVPVN